MNELKKELAYRIYSFLETPKKAKKIAEKLSDKDLEKIENGMFKLFKELAEEFGYGYCDICKKIYPEECAEILWERRMQKEEEAYA